MKNNFKLTYGFAGEAPRSLSFSRVDAARRAFALVVSRASLRFAELKSEDNTLNCSFAYFN